MEQLQRGKIPGLPPSRSRYPSGWFGKPGSAWPPIKAGRVWIREHHHEGHQRSARATDLKVAEVTPIDLGLFT
ncbi:hypothetical protein SAMN03159408_07221, partial [Burkholderia sp. NFPP32]|uniref:hypothetical protein n=1 Tax=Burkholderia sp. NFPP32 TaxID=1566267 RepID=UPI00090F51EA